MLERKFKGIVGAAFLCAVVSGALGFHDDTQLLFSMLGALCGTALVQT